MGGRVVLKVDVELEVPLAAFLVGRAEFQFQASQRTVLVSTCKSAVTCGGGGCGGGSARGSEQGL